MREGNSRALEHRALGEYAALAAAAFGSLPGIATEGYRIDAFNGRRDAVVKSVQIALDGRGLCARRSVAVVIEATFP
jgi:hypothetical protein